MSKINKRISYEDRKKIEELILKKESPTNICKEIGIWRTSFYRELKKCNSTYNAEEAQRNSNPTKNLIRWDIIGKKYGLLTILEYANINKKRTWWKCQCDCGEICYMSRKTLVEYCSPNRKLSCGCIPKEHAGNGNKVPIEESSLRKYYDLMAFKDIQGDCWEWTGYKQKGKTPKTSWKNKSMSVRKCMYLLMNDTTYEPNPVFTTCGNLLCFNPDHITLNRPAVRQFYDR